MSPSKVVLLSILSEFKVEVKLWNELAPIETS